MTGPEVRQIGLSWALEDFETLLADRHADDAVDELDDVDDLAGRTTEPS